MNDVELEEIDFQQSFSFREDILHAFVSMLTLAMLIYGFLEIYRKIQNVDFGFRPLEPRTHNVSTEDRLKFYVVQIDFNNNFNSTTHFKFEIAANINTTYHLQDFQVSFIVSTIVYGIQEDSEQYFHLYHREQNSPLTDYFPLYFTILPTNEAKVVVEMSGSIRYFGGFRTILSSKSDGVNILIILRDLLRKIVYASALIAVLQYYFAQKFFTTSCAISLIASALVLLNPLVTTDKCTDFHKKILSFCTSQFLSLYYSIIPVIGMSCLNYFENLPTICILYLIVMITVLFKCNINIFTENHIPFAVGANHLEYPTSNWLILATPLILFNSFISVAVLYFNFIIDKTIKRIYYMFSIIIQIISSYIAFTTIYAPTFLHDVLKLQPSASMFFGLFIQVICALVQSFVYINIFSLS